MKKNLQSKKQKKKKSWRPLSPYSDKSSEALKEKKAPKLPQIEKGQISFIFVISGLTSLLLIIFGIYFFIFKQSPTQLLVALLSIIIGAIQLLIDAGWMSLIKINHPDDVETWSEAIYFVSNVRGQKIFIIPVLIDIFVFAILLFFSS